MFSFIIVSISFILEGILSKYIQVNSTLFVPLLTLISLIIIYPYFHNHEKNFFVFSFITGILYDIVYTNTLCLYGIVFLIMAWAIKKINSVISNNSINVAIISLIIIIFYRTCTYLILCLVNYINFNSKNFLYSIASSLILNMIYSIVLYIITDFISRKKHISKLD